MAQINETLKRMRFLAGIQESEADDDRPGKPYESLNDAAERTGNLAYRKGSTKIWYMNEKGWRKFSMGAEFIQQNPKYGPLPTTEAELKATHILLGGIYEKVLGPIFGLMQGENWSPRGEARDLIKKLGLQHTSMSVGDVIQIGKNLWMVDGVGFTKLT
jgi:hypothetical protein